MKRKLFITLAIVGTLCFAGQFFTTAAHPGDHDKNAFTPDKIPWGPPPPFIAPGAQVAVIEGNPGASTGDYTVRVKMPDGYRIAPHWHPLRENVTVISGTFKVGMGGHLRQRQDGDLPRRQLRLPRSRHAPLRDGLRRSHRPDSRRRTDAIQLHPSRRRPGQELDSQHSRSIWWKP